MSPSALLFPAEHPSISTEAVHCLMKHPLRPTAYPCAISTAVQVDLTMQSVPLLVQHKSSAHRHCVELAFERAVALSCVQELSTWGARDVGLLGKLRFAGPRVRCAVDMHGADSVLKADARDLHAAALLQAAHGGQVGLFAAPGPASAHPAPPPPQRAPACDRS